MRVDRHRDIADDLEAELIAELKGISTQLRGSFQKISKRDSMGRSSKVIQIESTIYKKGVNRYKYLIDPFDEILPRFFSPLF